MDKHDLSLNGWKATRTMRSMRIDALAATSSSTVVERVKIKIVFFLFWACKLGENCKFAPRAS